MKNASIAISKKLALPALCAFALTAGMASMVGAVEGTVPGASSSSTVDTSSSSDNARSGLRSNAADAVDPNIQRVLKSRTIASQLARDLWFDKTAAASPELVAAVCAHPGAASLLAAHPHLDAIANADPYVCRRITRWSSATEVLLRNPHLDRVVQLDPEGMIWAIERRPSYARVLAGHVLFYRMAATNRDLGRVVAAHMY